jgi:SAM-dependent methyltransferase
LNTWRQITSHVIGLSLASSVWDLYKREILQSLPLKVDDIPGNSGYLHGLFRALDSLGWVDRASDGIVSWTERGKKLTDQAFRLEVVPELLESFSNEFLEVATGNTEIGDWLRGHQAAPVMLAPDEAGKPGPRELLKRLGWWNGDSWTDAGHQALRQSSIYQYPLSYLPMLRRTEELLFGDCELLRKRLGSGEEVHVDRRADIKFSGQVFSGSVAPVLWDIFLPLLDSNPAFLLDVGCGDGRMLAELGQRAPGVRLVGVDFNPVACEVAAENLRSFPGSLVVTGDVGNPKGLAETLAQHGLDLRDALVVTKSVIHNRPYKVPETRGPGRTQSCCADAQGRLISAADLEGSLIECLRNWKECLGRHGFLIVEVHATPCEVARACAGRTLAPAMELTHCYSGQLLVEPEVYYSAAEAAGLKSKAHREIGQSSFGHFHMTVDHFV